VRRAADQQDAARDQLEVLDSKIAELDRRRRNLTGRWLSAGRNARHEFATSISAEVARLREREDAAIKSIQDTEKTYSEHMGLQGPVTYWSKKATEHRYASWAAAAVGIAFAGGVAFYLKNQGATQVLELVKTTVNDTHQWQLAYVVARQTG
jgi:hypothetical protein